MDPPLIQFRFPAPQDNYSGEVTHGKGELILSKILKLDGAQGFVEVHPDPAVTMGDPFLDEVIQGSLMLDSKN